MEDLKAGCCGVVWGVYDFEPPLYEACFVHAIGEADMMFAENDVEEVSQSDLLPFAERLREIRKLMNREG
jgi:hypothetical protein